MKSSSRSRVLVVVLLSALAAGCPQSSSGGRAELVARNLGLAAVELAGAGDLWLISVSEASSGATDLNGDGDALDVVLHVYDPSAGSVSNLELAASQPASEPRDVVPPPIPQFERTHAAFFVEESAQGALDLDGDGDADGDALHVYDAATSTVHAIEHAVLASGTAGVALSGDFLACAVSELEEGADLSGNGSAGDSALLVTNLATGIGGFLPVELGSLALRIADGRVGFHAAESSASGDLNGDLDMDDPAVFQLYDLATGELSNTWLATTGEPPLVAGGTWTVVVSESDQGGNDLNGDGDALDWIQHVHDPVSGLSTNLGIASLFFPSVEADGALILADDESRSGRDKNGDGDAFDGVLVVVDPVAPRTLDTQLAVPGGAGNLAVVGDLIGFTVSEAAQGSTDLDLDGDAEDAVVHVHDLRFERTTNLGVDALWLAGTHGHLLLLREEWRSGLDWNGDGDREDRVLHVWDMRARRTWNSGWSVLAPFSAGSANAVLLTYELEQGRDLNGDGDDEDVVPVFFEPSARRATSLGHAVRQAELAGPATVLVLVDERSQGEDLNGDGDLEDGVVHDFRRGTIARETSANH